MSVASSTKSRSRTMVYFTSRFAFRRPKLNRHPSDLVHSLTPIVDEQKGSFKSIENKIPKRVDARTNPCFTLVWIVNGSETLPSYWTVAFVLV